MGKQIYTDEQARTWIKKFKEVMATGKTVAEAGRELQFNPQNYHNFVARFKLRRRRGRTVVTKAKSSEKPITMRVTGLGDRVVFYAGPRKFLNQALKALA